MRGLICKKHQKEQHRTCIWQRLTRVLPYFMALISALLFGIHPALAVNFGERADWDITWSKITTWPYGNEHFVAAERFKNGDPRIVFAGTNRHIAIYNSSTNTWQAIGTWPHYYSITDVTVRDGNTSIVFVGQYGRYAVLEFKSGAWRWVKQGIWPQGDRYSYHHRSYGITIRTVCDKPGPDNAVVMGGDGGYYAILNANNVFITGEYTGWRYKGSYNRAFISDTIPYDDGKILFLGQDGGDWLGVAVQWLNADNSLGPYSMRTFSGIVCGTKKGKSSYWWLSKNGILGADSLYNTVMYVGFTGPMSEWSNGTLFIGGNKQFKVWRYDGTFGKEGSAPVNIAWAEAQANGSILIAGNGKIYRGQTREPNNIVQPELITTPDIVLPTKTIQSQPFGTWNLSSPVRQTLYSYNVPDGGTMRSLTLKYSIKNTHYREDGGQFFLRIWGYQSSGHTRVRETLVAEIPLHVDPGETKTGNVAISFPKGVTYFKLTYEEENDWPLDENPRFRVNITLQSPRYYVYRINQLRIRWNNGCAISWDVPSYPPGTKLEYAVMKNGVQVRNWSTNTSYIDTKAVGNGTEKYAILCRYKGSSTYTEIPVAEESLQTAWNTAAINAIKNAITADNIPPFIEVKTLSGATATSGSSIRLIVAASDNSSTNLSYSINGGAYAPLPADGIITAPVSSPGPNTVMIRVKDEAGNVAAKAITIWKL
ncbi:MAG: hypothetical protein H0Z39_07010 [Peptococcaceae bacterium]|nr:hypothetical protein [Peptococcaceae bacterium]